MILRSDIINGITARVDIPKALIIQSRQLEY